MKSLHQIKELSFYPILLVLFVFVLFFNLGLPSLTADEPIRTVVAQELDYNDNLFVSTINDEFYYNKLPIYNWIILGFYKVTGSKAEWVSRAPTVVSLLLFCLTLYYWVKKHHTKEVALWTSFIFATGSRIWFYDSMLGLIDMFFGLLIFLSFIVTFEFHEKKKYLLLFVLTYLITAVCFLMKGLQAIAFQGMTLVAWFIYQKDFKKLFSLAHIVGVLSFFSILGLFFFFYTQTNSTDDLISTLWSESSKRYDGEESNLSKTVIHVLTFPIKNVLLDILPWGVFLFFLIKKEIRQQVFKHKLSWFCLIILGANIIVYWLSPETRGRYHFPHYALLAILIGYILQTSFVLGIIKKLSIASKLTHLILFFVIILISLWNLEVFHLDFKHEAELLNMKAVRSGIWICLGMGSISLLLIHTSKYKFVLALVSILVVLRLIFNSVIIPYRMIDDGLEFYKEEAIRVGKKYKDKPLIILGHTPINRGMTHYLMVEQNRIIPRHRHGKHEFVPGGYYLVYDGVEKYCPVEIIDSFKIEWNNETYYVAE